MAEIEPIEATPGAGPRFDADQCACGWLIYRGRSGQNPREAHHALDLSRRHRHGHRLQVPAGARGPAPARRLRPVPGPQAAAPAQLGGLPGAAAGHRRRGAHPRAPRPQRLPAAPGGAGLQRAGALHRRHARAVRPAAARLGAPAGRRGRVRQPPRLLEAPPGVAALHRSTTRKARWSCWRRTPSTRASSPSPACACCFAPPATCSARPACASSGTARSLLFSGDLGAQPGPADAPARAARAPPTGWWSKSTYGDRAAQHGRSADRDRRRGQPHRGARRHGADPGLRRGPRADACCYRLHLLKQQHRIPDAAGVPQQPDGDRRHRASTRATSTSTGCTPEQCRAMCGAAHDRRPRWKSRSA